MMAGSTEGLRLEGNKAFSEARYGKAESAYTKALAAAQDQGSSDNIHLIYSNRAAARLHLHDHAGALQDAEAALSILPSFAKALYRSGVALQHLGRLDEAHAQLGQALLQDPGSKETAKQLHSVNQARAQRALLQASLGVSPAAAGGGGGAAAPPGGGGGVEHHIEVKLNDSRGEPKWNPKLIPSALRAGHVFQGSPDGDNHNILVLLHGLGDSAKPFGELARKMALPQAATLSLSGPQAVPFSGGTQRSWFQAYEANGETIQGWTDPRRLESLYETVALLRQLVDNLVLAGWPHSRVHLFGFSQGGITALQLNQNFTGASRLGSCVAVASALLEDRLSCQEADMAAAKHRHAAASPSPAAAASASAQPQREAQPVPSPAAPPGPPVTPGGGGGGSGGGRGAAPVLMTVGDRDDLVPLAQVERTAHTLRAQGTSVTVYVVAGKGHGMVASEAEMRQLMTFWAKNLSSRPRGKGFQEVLHSGHSSSG